MTTPPGNNRPAIQIFVCENKRPPESPLPCCADARSGEVNAALRRAISRRGLGRAIWLTGSRCLTFCSAQGTTVVAWPSGTFFQGVKPGEAEALLDEVLEAHRATKAPM